MEASWVHRDARESYLRRPLLGYEVAMEDLPFPEMMEGEDSLLASDDVTVVPGHSADASRPILLGVTKG